VDQPAADAGSTPAGGAITDPHVERFITEYLANGMNGTAAYLAVHPDTSSPRVASTLAWRLLTNVDIRRRIDAERARLARDAEVDRDDLLKQLATIVTADPGELTQMRRVRCSDCWHDKDAGPHADPDPNCPRCGGEGEAQPWFADTRKLSPAGRALFLGVKVSDKGIQVLQENRDAAREKLARILGAYEADHRQKADALANMLQRINAAGSTLPVQHEPGDED
jgi:hypothetical protein